MITKIGSTGDLNKSENGVPPIPMDCHHVPKLCVYIYVYIYMTTTWRPTPHIQTIQTRNQNHHVVSCVSVAYPIISHEVS
jgi:hypothetical protein